MTIFACSCSVTRSISASSQGIATACGGLVFVSAALGTASATYGNGDVVNLNDDDKNVDH
jgi:hypothetical protein